MKATDVLREEHQVILRVLDCLAALVEQAEKKKDLNVDSLKKIIEFCRGFADACHHGKEENHLFPVLHANNISCPPGTQQILLAEHEEGRGYIKAIAQSIEDHEKGQANAINCICALSRLYIEHLTKHIHKEDKCLFPTADAKLSSADQEALLSKFENTEKQELETGSHEKYLKLANDLCKEWGVNIPTDSAHSSTCNH